MVEREERGGRKRDNLEREKYIFYCIDILF